MKKVIALLLAVTMIFGCTMVSSAYGSKGRSSVISVPNATTFVAKDGVYGTWEKAADGSWTCTLNGAKLTGWQLVYNPATQRSEWFFFGQDGKMYTGWQWIKDADGVTRCYLLTTSGSSLGACVMNGRTSDGYIVDKNGAWTVNGVVQTK